MELNNVILGLGSNLGNREQYLIDATSLLNNMVGPVYIQSSRYETAPWGITNQPLFMNQVVALRTAFSPHELLQHILSIEHQLNRIRTIKWGERTIDIDILLYNDSQINTPDLVIPHPLMHERDFVLRPLLEIFPNLVHPTFQVPFSSFLTTAT